MVLDLDLVLLLLLYGASSKNEISCNTCSMPPKESNECLGVNSGEEAGVRMDFSMFQVGRNEILNMFLLVRSMSGSSLNGA
jgi:hypothetical protein